MKKIHTIILILLCLPAFATEQDYHPQKFKGRKQIEYVINQYFENRYQSIQNITDNNFSYLTADWLPETRDWYEREQTLHEIILYQAKIFNLNYEKYNFQIEILGIKYLLDGEKAVVNLNESHQVVFAANQPVISRMSEQFHKVSLRRKSGIWYITYDKYQHIYLKMLKDYSKDEIISFIDQSYELGEAKDYTRNTKHPLANRLLAYDRSAAMRYANKYWNNKNPHFDYFPGNNCTNYISQILLAGGAPMDARAHWNWFYDNSIRAGSTYSLSWTVVSDLYKYLTHNTFTGPIGHEVGLSEMQPGDVIQYYIPSKGWMHSVLLSIKLDYYPNNNQLNYLINSNSYDRQNYPLAYFSGMEKRYIKIDGYIDKK